MQLILLPSTLRSRAMHAHRVLLPSQVGAHARNEAMECALDSAAIGIPYPRMSIHGIYMDKLNSEVA
jgi:hypothetical protein